jgi:hypothetical protein
MQAAGSVTILGCWSNKCCACWLAGGKSPGAKGSRPQQQQQVSHYTSYKISLKPSVAAIRGTGSAAGANGDSMSQLRQQQQQQWGSMPAQRSSATLSQLLQHPQLAQQQQQQQMWQAAGSPGNSQQLPGRAFAEQMLQLYNQQDAGAAQLPMRQQQNIQQLMLQQQQQDVGNSKSTPQAAAGLPALQMCSSPVPLSADSPLSSSNQQAGPFATGGGLDSLSSSMAAGMQGMLRSQNAVAGAAAARRSLSPGASHASMLLLPGRLPGGMTAAAGQVLASNAASYYNGVGPLTGGAKQGWSTGKYGQGMEAGKCLAEVRGYLVITSSYDCEGSKSDAYAAWDSCVPYTASAYVRGCFP